MIGDGKYEVVMYRVTVAHRSPLARSPARAKAAGDYGPFRPGLPRRVRVARAAQATLSGPAGPARGSWAGFVAG
jgi:hypothetical protein